MRLALFVACLVVAALVPSPAMASPASCRACLELDVDDRGVEVAADAVFTQGGRVVMPGRLGRTGGSSSCPGCRWSSYPVGAAQRQDRMPSDVYGLCAGAAGDARLLYVTRPGSAQEFLSLVCTVPTGPGRPPLTLGMVEAELRRLVERVPPEETGLGFAPAGGTVVNLPTIVFATPSGVIDRRLAPFGLPVRVVLDPSWEWSFEPGAGRVTDHPGQPYRSGRPVARDPGYVTYAYRSPGERSLAVTVRWAASYSLDGAPLTALGEVTRGGSVSVPVREAPSRLVAG